MESVNSYRNKNINGFRGDFVQNGDITLQSDTLAPDYKFPDTKIKNHTVVINSIDRNWYNYPNETPYNYLVKLGGSAKDKYSTVSYDYKNWIAVIVWRYRLSRDSAPAIWP